MKRFAWTPASTVIGPKGSVLLPVPVSSSKLMLIPDQSAALCLQQTGAAFLGHSEFCIGTIRRSDTQQQSGRPGYFQCLTAGSSGTPKRLRRSHASWIESFIENAGLWQITSHDSYAILGALSHSLALYSCLEALYLEADLLLLSGVRPDQQSQQIDSHRSSILYATPTQIRQLSSYAPNPLPGLRQVIIGGAALDAITQQAARTLCPNANIVAFYGAAETSFISLTDGNTPDGSVGRAYPNVEISVRDATGLPVSSGATGELWVHSPYLFDAYCDRVASAKSADGFISVGEVGRLDVDGYLFLTGRKSRMFTVADQNIFPEAIEHWFQARGVEPVAAVPRRDHRLGHVVVLITLEDCQSTAQLKILGKGLAMHAMPRDFLSVAQWPTLASGKTDLRALAALVDAIQ
ncbi:MAG: AMP-binding protein [Rhodobacterales bacterium]